MVGLEELKNYCETGNIEMLKNTIQQIEDINIRFENGITALMYACENGYNDVIKLLINNGADVNVGDIHQKTALMYACEKGDEEAVKILIKNNADVNAKNILGKTPIMYSSVNEDLAIIEELIDNGANINEKDRLGCTALMYASYYAKENSVKKLLEHNIDVNIRDNIGKTALIYACYYSNINIIHNLITHGVDIDAKSKEGTTALRRAYLEDNKHLMKYLLMYGADTNSISKKEWEMLYREDYVLKIAVAMNRNDKKSLESYLNSYYNALDIKFENHKTYGCNIERSISQIMKAKEDVLSYIDLGTKVKKTQKEGLKRDIKLLINCKDDDELKKVRERIIKERKLDSNICDNELLDILKKEVHNINDVIEEVQLFRTRLDLSLKKLILDPIYYKRKQAKIKQMNYQSNI